MSNTSVFSKSTQRTICLLAAIALIASCSVLAFGADNAQAATKKKVNVIKNMKVVVPCTDYDEVSTDSFSYNSVGLVKKVKSTEKHGDIFYRSKATLTYKKRVLKKMVEAYIEGASDKITIAFKADGKGRVGKKTVKGGHPYKYTYDSKGHLKKITWRSDGWDCSYKYKYDSKGRVTKIIYDDPSYADGIYRFKYDKHGQILKSWDAGLHEKGKGDCYTHKNTYKHGRLVKKVVKRGSHVVETRTYTYKKVSVPKSLVKMVKGQQRVLTNDYIMQIYPSPYLGIESAHK